MMSFHLPYEVLYIILKQAGFDRILTISLLDKSHHSFVQQEKTWKGLCFCLGINTSRQEINWKYLFFSTFFPSNFLISGPVDSGKSTILGQLLIQHGLIPEQTQKRNRRDADFMGNSSYHYAWISDKSKEERERGITIQSHIHFVPPTLDSPSLIVLHDTPGHYDYTKSLIASSWFCNFGIIVIESSFGESHIRFGLFLASFHGYSKILILINKASSIKFDKNTWEDKKNSILNLNQRTNHEIDFIPCAGFQGINLVNPTLEYSGWFNGATVWESICDLSKEIRFDLASCDHPTIVLLRRSFRNLQVLFENSRRKLPLLFVVPAYGTLIKGQKLKFFHQNQFYEVVVKTIQLNHKQVDYVTPGTPAGICIEGIPEYVSNFPRIPSGTPFFDALKFPQVEHILSFTARVVGSGYMQSTYLRLNSCPLVLCCSQKFVARVTQIIGLEISSSEYNNRNTKPVHVSFNLETRRSVFLSTQGACSKIMLCFGTIPHEIPFGGLITNIVYRNN